MIRDISPEGSDRSDLADSSSRGPDVPDPHAVPIKPAVSVLMIRDGATGLEVFVQHRVSTMDFAAGVVVFPGGRVDPIDEQTAAAIEMPGAIAPVSSVKLVSASGSVKFSGVERKTSGVS